MTEKQLLPPPSTSEAATSEAATSEAATVSQDHDHPAGPKTLARIEPAQRISFLPVPVDSHEELTRVRNLQIGTAVLIVGIGLMMIPFGFEIMTFVFVAGVIFAVIGVMSGRVRMHAQSRLALRRAEKLGEVSYVQGLLTAPTHKGPEQFFLHSPHTLIREWQRLHIDGEAVTICSMLIAQDGRRAVLYSDEACSSEEARDYGFGPGETSNLARIEADDRVRVPLRGIQELSRLIDADPQVP